MKRKSITLFSCLLFAAYMQAQLPTIGLTAYYPFNGNAVDASGNGNNGTVNGATLVNDRFGNCNSAYSFNGTSNYIVVPNATDVDMGATEDFTVAFWVKTASGNANGPMLSKSTVGVFNGYQFFSDNTIAAGYCSSPGQLSFYTASDAFEDACANGPVADDYTNWYFITGKYDHILNKSYLYVNGMLQGDIGESSGTISTIENLYLGCATNGTLFFAGLLDDIRIYKRLLSNTEITTLYNEPNPLNVGLMAYYPFDGNAMDGSGNGHNGTVNGATLVADRFGNANKAYSFDGTNDNIVIPHHTDIDMLYDDFSICFWIKTASGNTDATILSKSDAGDGYQFFSDNPSPLYCNTAGQLSFYTAASPTQDACANSAIADDYSNWYFITGVHDYAGNNTYLYVNGVLQTDVGQRAGSLNTSVDLCFGSYPGGISFFNGLLDDIRIYKRALSGCEVNLLYNLTSTPVDIGHAVFLKQLDGSYYQLRGNSELLFKLDGEYSASNLKFSILDKFNVVVANDATPGIISSPGVDPGDNRYMLNFSSGSYPSGYYVLKVTNEKKENMYLRFKK
ncbi:MAG: 5-Nucleotidase domain protein [Bacteroidetes bacterium]|jgi:hypothetical protein|nr:5-Nucleotidase domain protein [Bacteroidota bacterium]